MREQLASGIDPLELKRIEAQKVKISTFEEAARKVHQEQLSGWRNKKHEKQWLSTSERYAFPFIGVISIEQITPAMIAEVLRPIWLTISGTASRVR